MNARSRAAALLEVLGVYLAGPLVTGLLIKLFDISFGNPLTGFTAAVSDAELVEASWKMLVLLVLQYAGWFLLIVPINWYHRRRGPSAYGLTKAGRSGKALVLAGIATAAVAAWPSIGVMLLDAAYDLGPTVSWRQALFDTSWRRWEFWLFMAVLSYAFVAVVEELFFRGYFQRRLAEDWGHGPAIIGIALLFVFAHRQYLEPNLYNASFVASLLVLAVGLGVVFAWTGSLIPSIVAHALINVPMTPRWHSVAFATLLMAAFLLRRRALDVAAEVFSSSSLRACVALGFAGVAWAVAAQRLPQLQYVAAAMVLVAVIIESMERRQLRAAGPVQPSA